MNADSDIRHSVKHFICFISVNPQVTLGRRYYYASQFTYGNLRLADVEELVTWYFPLVRHCMQITYTLSPTAFSVSFTNQVHPSTETLAYRNRINIKKSFSDHNCKSISGRGEVLGVFQVWHFCLVYMNEALMIGMLE